MTFQTTVNTYQGFGVPGELFLDGPTRAQPGIIDSTGVTNPNRVGRAFTQVAGADGHCTIGGTPAEGAQFYGILANPKVYPERGTTSGTLAPSLDLPQYAVGEFLTMATGLIVTLDAAANIGDFVDFDTTTGALTPRAISQPSTGAQQVAYASNVATVTLTPAGAPAIGVGSVLTTADGQTATVSAVLTGTGGNGTYTVSAVTNHAAQSFSYTSVPLAGKANIARARVVRYNISAAGNAVIEMTG